MPSTKKPAKPKACTCIALVNAQLPDGIELDTRIQVDFAHGTSREFMAVSLRRKSGRGKVPTMVATFCPVCGKKYQVAK